MRAFARQTRLLYIGSLCLGKISARITSLPPELRIVSARSNKDFTISSTDKDKSCKLLLPASTKVTSILSSETR
ncbi:hypothetical protein DPMN_132730 [Dreissena polymorpha]|uniref:Uncharacterized protein n=1 Tax=Dreissena polymorpha TaxID=45954 RepID=A0A9D4FT04_DREPO|nr:hypothetical protein DPMN_132730 [Dreissena polymorpha]